MRKVLLTTAAIMAVSATGALAQQGPGIVNNAYGTIGYQHMDVEGADLGAITGRLGARVNPYLGVEAEAGIGVRGDTIAGVDVDQRWDAGIYGVGFLPVAENFELLARVGYGVTDSKARVGALRVNDRTESWNYGVGAQYFFDGSNGVRADWTRRDFVGSSDVNADVWSLNFVRRF